MEIEKIGRRGGEENEGQDLIGVEEVGFITRLDN